MTHTFLVTVTLDDDEDLEDVADEIYDALQGQFGPETSVKPWALHGDESLPEL